MQVSATTLTYVPRNTVGDSYLRKKQLEDEVVGPILRAMETQSKPDIQTLRGGPREMYQLAQLWDQLVLILYRVFEGENGKKSYPQLMVPKDSREEILEESHAGSMSGHLGEDITLAMIKVLLARLF